MLCRLILLFLILLIIYAIISIIVTIKSRKIFRGNIDESKQVIHLTFDDGCNSKFTPMLLDLLKEHNIKATFFVLGSTIEENKDIILRMKNEGHLIASHGYEHKNHILMLPYMINKDIKKCKDIYNKLSIPFIYYRPPWGHFNLFTNTICNKYKLKIILWNVIVGDWQKDITADILIKRLEEHKEKNKVICLHDGRGKNDAPQKTIDALKIMIPKWRKKGYEFETVDNLY